ncbi:hypothetical protein SmJEL517_g02773 [Synchytrium microbalum]|uniref:F-box domain-containing protein n=1 Tax=Synchytrium microbalum TaxID=1806994 RepID=A0A507C4Y4_9FUNG|nr:uncharacterized protein SmJEL517_g02773 [Synchytrium microbalum]TPX34742.1 hypothetical protein SmJEL517_g02773 [Synchytrium microbalum]
MDADDLLREFSRLATTERTDFLSGLLELCSAPELRRLQEGLWNRRAFGLDLLSELPQEISCHILSFLPAPDLGMIARVSSRWKLIVDDPSAWKTIWIANIGNLQPLKLPMIDYRSDVRTLLEKLYKWKRYEVKVSRFVALSVATRVTASKLVPFPDGKQRVVIGTGSRALIVYEDFASPVQLAWWECHSVSVVEGTPEVIVTGSFDQTIQCWDWEGNRLQTMRGHLNSVTTLALANELLFSSGPDKSLIAWNWKTGARLRMLHEANVSSLKVADNVLISGSFDGKITLYSTDAERPLEVLCSITLPSPIISLDYSHSRLILSCGSGLILGKMELKSFNQEEFESGLCFVHSISSGMVRWCIEGHNFVVARGDGLELWSVHQPVQQKSAAGKIKQLGCSYVRTLRQRSTGASVFCAFETDSNSWWAVTKQSALYVYSFVQGGAPTSL